MLTGKSKEHNRILNLAILVSTALTLMSCGKEAFQVIKSEESKQAPGHFTVQPKVDIVLVTDDTGSIGNIFSQISQQMRTFLTDLSNSGWNYQFTNIPLTRRVTLTQPSSTLNAQIRQITASKHDPNWGTDWIAPFPGATRDNLPRISPRFFVRPESYTQFVSYLNLGATGDEPGLERILQNIYFLEDNQPQTGYFREDAILAVIMVGNGDDTSGVTFGYNSMMGGRVRCEKIGCSASCPCTWESSLDEYKDAFRLLRGGNNRFFSVVSNTRRTNCQGAPAYAGERYAAIADITGGRNYDVCTTSISSALQGVKENLQFVKIQYRKRYVLIAQEPNPATIVVTRYRGGDPNSAEVIPNDSVNGWTYAGHVENVFEIDSPVEMNPITGFAIELHGTAKLIGDDAAYVTYKPVGG